MMVAGVMPQGRFWRASRLAQSSPAKGRGLQVGQFFGGPLAHDCTLRTFATDATKPSSKRIAGVRAIGEHPRIAVRDVLEIGQLGDDPGKRGGCCCEEDVEGGRLGQKA
jgi:hypothetical protein